MKWLYQEVKTFHNYAYRDEDNSERGVCCVIKCSEAFTDMATMNLYHIFQGKTCWSYLDGVGNDFLDLRRHISKFFTGNTDLPQENSERVIDVSLLSKHISIGNGAQKRLVPLGFGKRLPYERLFEISTDADLLPNHSFVSVIPSNTTFHMDDDFFADSNIIEAYLCKNQKRTIEEDVFLQFIRDIRSKRKRNGEVARVSSISGISCLYGVPTVHIEKINYIDIIKMSLLDTLFSYEGKATTLRKKYSLPYEEQEAFTYAPKLANHCGCGVFFITSDGYLVYQDRAVVGENRVAFFPGKYSYTVSGSYLMDNRDIFEFMKDKVDHEMGGEYSL